MESGFSLDWLAPTLVGAGSLLTSGVAAIVAWRASKKADQAAATGVETHKAVNSRMDEMLKLAREEATATATAVAQEAERLRTAAQVESQRLIEASRSMEAVRVAASSDSERAQTGEIVRVGDEVKVAEVNRPRRKRSKGDAKR